MATPKNTANLECAVYVDAGTTNTRVWLACGGEVVARAYATVGVRDTARDGTSARLRSTLHDLIAQVRREANECSPSCVVAAGMITSPLGLAEVPHVTAPAGLSEIAAGVGRHCFPDVTDLPILLVPGVRSGPSHCDAETVGTTDVMRGEETLCMGLLALGLLKAPATLLNLGSHWKAIQVDVHGRIVSSVTSLSGEMIHAAQTQTILASAVPRERATALDEGWIKAGMEEQRRSGLARALFCVRLLETFSKTAPEERLAFLVGAFISADLDALVARSRLTIDLPVVIAGAGAVAEAWRHALSQVSISATLLTEAQVEHALLTGLQYVMSEQQQMNTDKNKELSD